MSGIDLDRAPVANDQLHSQVPVVDLDQDHVLLVDQIGQACRDWGFFQIVGHGIDDRRIAEVISTARSFFAQDRHEKHRYLRSRDNPWADRELTKEQRDRKEIFDIGLTSAAPRPTRSTLSRARHPRPPSRPILPRSCEAGLKASICSRRGWSA